VESSVVKEVAAPRNLPEIPAVRSDLPPDSGLVLVETRHETTVAIVDETVEIARPKRTRPPRVEVSNEPLEMVETHKDATPPGP
jgi:hypothetical protein